MNAEDFMIGTLAAPTALGVDYLIFQKDLIRPDGVVKHYGSDWEIGPLTPYMSITSVRDKFELTKLCLSAASFQPRPS